MKKKTLGLIFAMITIGSGTFIGGYVLYYTFVGDITNFNMPFMWSCGLGLIILPLLYSFLSVCSEDDKNE